MFDRLTTADIPACLDLGERVGWPRAGSRWDWFFELGPVWGKREGAASLSAMVSFPQHEGAQFVAMMVVDPAFQKRGLGVGLLTHALEATPRVPTMLYATDEGRPLYEKVGFREVDTVARYLGVPRDVPAASGARAATASDVAWIVDADARAFGFRRAKLLRTLIAASSRIVVDDRGGYVIRWPFAAIDVLSPVVAESPEAASSLIRAAIEGATRPVRVDLTGSTGLVLADELVKMGLAHDMTTPLMLRGAERLAGERSRYFAAAFLAVG